jgi:iron complex outermembrane recepter protein
MVSTTLFEHSYDDLRTVELTTPIVQANGGRGRSRGVEFFFDWDVTSWWRLRAGGFVIDQDSWLKRGSLDSERGAGEVSYPDHQFLLRSTFWPRENVSAWFSLRQIDDVPTLESTAIGRVPAYVELDARVGWRVRSDLEVSVTGRNLLDRSHPEIGPEQRWREIPRSVQAMIRWDF